MSARESIPAPLRLGLSGPTAIHEAIAAARGFAQSAGIGPDGISRVVVVVEELVTNLYDHGELGDADIFEIELSLADGAITLVLVDPGKPFDPLTVSLDREVPSRGGGAGLKLVRAWASHIDYQTGDGRNRLSVRLPTGR